MASSSWCVRWGVPVRDHPFRRWCLVTKYNDPFTWADFLDAWADYLSDADVTLELSYTEESLTLDLKHPRHRGPITRWLLDPPSDPPMNRGADL